MILVYSVFDCSHSLFSAIFEDKNRDIWEPFVSVSEEEQDHLLALLEKRNHRKTRKRNKEGNLNFNRRVSDRFTEKKCDGTDDPSDKMNKEESALPTNEEDNIETEVYVPSSCLFQKIDKNLRNLLKRRSEGELVCSVDKIISSHFYFNDWKCNGEDLKSHSSTLRYPVVDPYHRLICHGVCQYYALLSHSRNLPNGERVLIISTSKRRPLIKPSQTLTAYLSSVG